MTAITAADQHLRFEPNCERALIPKAFSFVSDSDITMKKGNAPSWTWFLLTKVANSCHHANILAQLRGPYPVARRAERSYAYQRLHGQFRRRVVAVLDLRGVSDRWSAWRSCRRGTPWRDLSRMGDIKPIGPRRSPLVARYGTRWSVNLIGPPVREAALPRAWPSYYPNM